MNIGKFHMRGSKRYGQRTHPQGYQKQSDQGPNNNNIDQSPPQQSPPPQHNQQQSQQQSPSPPQQHYQYQPSHPLPHQPQLPHQQPPPPKQHGYYQNNKYSKSYNNGSNNNSIHTNNNNNNSIGNNYGSGVNNGNANVGNGNGYGRGGYRGGHRGGGYRGGSTIRGGGHRGSRGGHRGGGHRGGYNNSYYKSPRSLKAVVTIPQFSGGVIIGVRGSLWGLLNKATTARLKVFKTSAVIRCSDAQQLDRAKEIVLKLKNTAPKYLSLIDYKGDQRLKFIQQPPNVSIAVLENNVNNEHLLTQEHDKELVKGHESSFVGKYAETLNLLYSERERQTPFVDIKTGTIWFLYSSGIPSTPMNPEKYELYTESLDSIFQTNTIINEPFIQRFKLFKEKKPYTLITLLDTQSLDIITLKCKEEKVSAQTPEEYRFVDLKIYKIHHRIASKILFPQASKLGPYDLRISIDTYSKSPCTVNNNNHNHQPQPNNSNVHNRESNDIPENSSFNLDNLFQFISNIKIFKNSNNNYSYQISDSNLYIVESIINQKISIYREGQIQFNLIQDLSTRYTTNIQEFNKQTNTILCTSSNLYDMFKSKNWTVDKALDEIKSLVKNIRILISNHFDSSKSPLVPPHEIHSNDHEIADDNDEDDEDDEENHQYQNPHHVSDLD